MAMMFASFDELQRARSKSSLRSSSSLYSLGSSPSFASIDSRSSKWDEHVKMTLRRNERIRLQSEATKLRDAFVQHDPRLTGAVPGYLLRSCLKAGGAALPDSEMRAIFGRFKTSDGHFAWLRFCESLEGGKEMPSFHPKRASRPASAIVGGGLGPRNTTVSSQFLHAKGSRRSLLESASMESLGASGQLLAPAKAPSRMRRMISEASLATQQKDSKMQGLADWYSKQETVLASRPASAGPLASVARPVTPPAYVPPTPPPQEKALTHEQKFQKEKELKQLMSMAEEGLNSRFSDMYKAFQYIDLDRSGRLSRDEISRALDLWNIPMDDAKLDLLLGDCDMDGDGGVSYEEFVDKLARGTVSNAAMGKRGMQSKEAMGVDSQEMLAEQLGHKKLAKFKPSLNK